MMNSSPNEFFELLLTFFRSVVRRERGMKSCGGLGLPQVVLLDALQRKSHYKMRELSLLLAIGMSAATGMADRLVKAGLITRSRDEKDRRVVWVSITPKGRQLFRQFRRAREETFRAMFQGLSQKEQGAFVTLFRRICRNLQ